MTTRQRSKKAREYTWTGGSSVNFGLCRPETGRNSVEAITFSLESEREPERCHYLRLSLVEARKIAHRLLSYAERYGVDMTCPHEQRDWEGNCFECGQKEARGK